MAIYLAGPMSGIDKMNFPAFDAAAESLRERGYTVLSPAEMDDAAVREATLKLPAGVYIDANTKVAGQSWGDFLSRDVKIIADAVDTVVLLPRWFMSRGARLEAFVGVLCKHKFYEYHDGTLVRRARWWILDEIYHSTNNQEAA